MTKFKIYIKYIKYILRHKYWVYRILILKNKKMTIQAILHDISKFLPDEFFNYAMYYHLDKKIDITKSWHKHILRNKHHWQYWIFINNEGEIQALEMPKKYVMEMIADWYAVAITETGIDQIDLKVNNWYQIRKNVILLHPDTRNYLEKNLRTFIY